MPRRNQKKLLALDGGGILGLISLGVLKKIESDLRKSHGNNPKFRLRDFFDYFAGTSTGAIITAGLAIGRSVDELTAFYIESGEEMFDRASLFRRWRYSYDATSLSKKLKREFTSKSILQLQKDGTLSTDRHLMVVMRNINTDSSWPISSNPAAKYNNPKRADCNLHLPLWQIVRASTAAPTFFAPEKLDLGGGKKFFFEDGGVTPYNNPAFLLFKMATLPEYKCGWETGEDKMMLVSVGTGAAFRTLETPDGRGEGLLTSAKTIPSELMRGFAVENDINCRTMGRCVYGAKIDSEIGDLIHPHDPARPKDFLFARYDFDVSQKGLEKAKLGGIKAEDLTMDNASMIKDLMRIGKVAGKQVDMNKHFKPFLPG